MGGDVNFLIGIEPPGDGNGYVKVGPAVGDGKGENFRSISLGLKGDVQIFHSHGLGVIRPGHKVVTSAVQSDLLTLKEEGIFPRNLAKVRLKTFRWKERCPSERNVCRRGRTKRPLREWRHTPHRKNGNMAAGGRLVPVPPDQISAVLSRDWILYIRVPGQMSRNNCGGIEISPEPEIAVRNIMVLQGLKFIRICKNKIKTGIRMDDIQTGGKTSGWLGKKDKMERKLGNG